MSDNSSVKSSNNHRKGWYWKGKHLSLTHRKNISLALSGHKQTPEHIKHVSITVKKWWSKPENRELMRARQLGTLDLDNITTLVSNKQIT